jgi:hypothetical protein
MVWGEERHQHCVIISQLRLQLSRQPASTLTHRSISAAAASTDNVKSPVWRVTCVSDAYVQQSLRFSTYHANIPPKRVSTALHCLT